MAEAGDRAPTGNDALIAQLLAGKNAGNQTTTTSSNINSAGMGALLRQILEGTNGSNGLAGVQSGQRRAGVYNSTTSQMLTNDFVTRAAGELAKQQAGTTSTVTKGSQSSGDVLKQILAAQAIKRAGKLFDGESKKSSKQADKKPANEDSNSATDDLISGLSSVLEKLGLKSPSSSSSESTSPIDISSDQLSLATPASDEGWTALFDSFNSTPTEDLGGVDFGSGSETIVPGNSDSPEDFFYDLPEEDDGFGFLAP